MTSRISLVQRYMFFTTLKVGQGEQEFIALFTSNMQDRVGFYFLLGKVSLGALSHDKGCQKQGGILLSSWQGVAENFSLKGVSKLNQGGSQLAH